MGAPSGGAESSGNGTPNVAIAFSPNPVSNAGNGSWNYSLTLSETGGAAVALTGLSVNGHDYTSQISQWFGSNQIPASGNLSGSFTTTGNPGGLTWTITGGGKTWSGTVNLLP